MPDNTLNPLTDDAPLRPWEAPRLFALSTLRTESGLPSPVETTTIVEEIYYFYGPEGGSPTS